MIKIKPKKVTVRDLFDGYVNNAEEGVFAYGGLLNIRPKYQREFVYKDKQRDAVIDTLNRGLPLNVMYWAKNEDDTYEVLDGQQRSISICSYVNGEFSINYRAFHNLTKEEQDEILDYELMVYEIQGNDKEKLDWFKTVNIAGEKLTNQELRNAVYTGTWLTDAKKRFSQTGGAAYQEGGKDYLKGSAIRQDYLETVLKWISEAEDQQIEDYMSKHQHDQTATALWDYYKKVINWVETTFTVYRKEMKGVDWGILYNNYKDDVKYDSLEMEEKIKELMIDDDVTKKSGVFEYLLSGEEKVLSIRAFTEAQKIQAFEKQSGLCIKCLETFTRSQMQADHIIPWSQGGTTTSNNCQMLCQKCNNTKSDN